LRAAAVRGYLYTAFAHIERAPNNVLMPLILVRNVGSNEFTVAAAGIFSYLIK
jgi:hypothetical protein